MKNLFTLLLTLLIGSFSLNGQCGNLIIGGVIDGPLAGGNPKGIQICATGAVADLSIYGIGVANNGGGSDGQEFTFPAEAAMPGDCFWIGSTTTGWAEFFGFTPCYTSSVGSINGDDPVELFCNGVVEDEFGDVALDGTGLCWDHLDGWAVNNTTTPNAGAFDCADWTFSGTNALDGETTNAGAATPYPNAVQTCPLAATPIELSSFALEAMEARSIKIMWTTASEVGNDFFAIEHSTDGVRFSTIGEIAGAGDSYQSINYDFIHNAPARGLNYYRLKQVDFSRAHSLSEVKSIAVSGAGELEVWPTLVADLTRIDLGDKVMNGELHLINAQGQVVLRQLIEGQTGVYDLDLSQVSNGAYILSLNSNGAILNKRIIVQ